MPAPAPGVVLNHVICTTVTPRRLIHNIINVMVSQSRSLLEITCVDVDAAVLPPRVCWFMGSIKSLRATSLRLSSKNNNSMQ